MILLGSILLVALGVVPLPWGAALIAGAALIEVGETVASARRSRRRPPAVGAEALVGGRAKVLRPCRPVGQVRVQGEIWRAHCDDGAEEGEMVRVRAVRGLDLVVERAG
jgi:membrane-bound serine protease (ClpP class)